MSQKIQALLVEDNLIAQIAAQAVLEHKKFEVRTASSGKEALEIVQKEKFDLIFMDIGLEEGTDGILVTEKIQNNTVNKETPVVILSSNSKETYRKRLGSIRYIDFFNKPLTGDKVDRLLDIIESVKKK